MSKLLPALLLCLVVLASPLPCASPDFRYQRTVTVPPVGRNANACATLDAAVYAHALPSLNDMRLYDGSREIPYAITLSESSEAESEPAPLRNLGQHGGEIVFDLAMPPRSYTEVQLDLDARNFIASAEVTAGDGRGVASTHLGTFTLFDLTAQRLGRSTTLPLQDSRFSLLHVVLRFVSAPGTSGKVPTMAAVRGATVPPSREEQTLYTVVAETPNVVQRGRETLATLLLPARVPAERVSLVLAPAFTGNFSRDVTVTAHARLAPKDEAAEQLTGRVERVRLTRAGREIRRQQLGFPATLGANLQEDATVEVHIQNGDDAPLPLRAVRLEMRERRLYFPVPTPADPHARPQRLDLFYGDPALEAPRYDFARLFSPAPHPALAALSPESLNPLYIAAPPRPRSPTERYPELLWVVLLGVICVLATVALHATKRLQKG